MLKSPFYIRHRYVIQLILGLPALIGPIGAWLRRSQVQMPQASGREGTPKTWPSLKNIPSGYD